MAEDPEASSGQSGELLNRAVNGVDRKGEGIEEGRRILKTSLTLQEVTESKVNCLFRNSCCEMIRVKKKKNFISTLKHKE